MPDIVAALLVDPMVHQLTTMNSDQMPAGGPVGAGLDVLASCAAVGLRRDHPYFTQAMAQWLGLDADHITIPPGFPALRSSHCGSRRTRQWATC